ncbi:hypothetical protein P4O66_003614 [Electrophorus voltai]|uniref:Sulfotransferase domain-containing protein n=1 Tax=Electrophorus voltai TaxID=2609070 RepID=A0AAD9E4G8_9TELE|nr:hypothetical protein P4O66_003614 [Electrophorus voltai]
MSHPFLSFLSQSCSSQCSHSQTGQKRRGARLWIYQHSVKRAREIPHPVYAGTMPLPLSSSSRGNTHHASPTPAEMFQSYQVKHYMDLWKRRRNYKNSAVCLSHCLYLSRARESAKEREGKPVSSDYIALRSTLRKKRRLSQRKGGSESEKRQRAARLGGASRPSGQSQVSVYGRSSALLVPKSPLRNGKALLRMRSQREQRTKTKATVGVQNDLSREQRARERGEGLRLSGARGRLASHKEKVEVEGAPRAEMQLGHTSPQRDQASHNSSSSHYASHTDPSLESVVKPSTLCLCSLWKCDDTQAVDIAIDRLKEQGKTFDFPSAEQERERKSKTVCVHMLWVSTIKLRTKQTKQKKYPASPPKHNNVRPRPATPCTMLQHLSLLHHAPCYNTCPCYNTVHHVTTPVPATPCTMLQHLSLLHHAPCYNTCPCYNTVHHVTTPVPATPCTMLQHLPLLQHRAPCYNTCPATPCTMLQHLALLQHRAPCYNTCPATPCTMLQHLLLLQHRAPCYNTCSCYNTVHHVTTPAPATTLCTMLQHLPCYTMHHVTTPAPATTPCTMLQHLPCYTMHHVTTPAPATTPCTMLQHLPLLQHRAPCYNTCPCYTMHRYNTCPCYNTVHHVTTPAPATPCTMLQHLLLLQHPLNESWYEQERDATSAWGSFIPLVPAEVSTCQTPYLKRTRVSFCACYIRQQLKLEAWLCLSPCPPPLSRGLMPRTLDSQITMEKTPSYFVTQEAPHRIASMSRETKLIVVVRNPVTRAISDYTQTLSKKPDIPSFEELAFKNRSQGMVDTSWNAIRIGMYIVHLENWLQYFRLSQIHFVSGERLITDPAGELGRVQDFLGLKRIITDKHFYFNRTKGFPCLKKPESSSLPRCLGKSKGRTHVQIDQEVIEQLRDFYRPFNVKFYEMVGHDFSQRAIKSPRILSVFQAPLHFITLHTSWNIPLFSANTGTTFLVSAFIDPKGKKGEAWPERKTCYLHDTAAATLYHSTKQDRQALQRVVCSAECITHTELPDLQTIYYKRYRTKARRIVKDPTHPNNRLFSLLRSGKCFRSLKTKTERLKRSFFPQAIRALNQGN